MTRVLGRQPIYPWSTMQPGEVITYIMRTDREVRNIRRNVSQYGVRNGKGFRCKLDRSTTPATISVTRLR